MSTKQEAGALNPGTKKSSSRKISTLKPREHFVHANGVRLCVQERGPSEGPAIVFIMGFACQLTAWPPGLLNALAKNGYRVICFDNRDIGLSQKMQSIHKVDTRLAFIQHRLGRRFKANYTLYDMAEDTAGLLDTLELKAAHIVGASMGGMIAQILAAKHPERVASLSLFMTSNNSPRQPMPKFSVLKEFATVRGVDAAQQDSSSFAIERWMVLWKAIQSPAYPKSNEQLKVMIEANYQRSYRPGGVMRQLQAIMATGSISKLLARITAPTILIHGKDDPLLPLKSAQDIARRIPGSVYYPIAGMGHDFPEELIPYFAELIIDNASQVRAQNRVLGDTLLVS
jgi:pimeloyl-ACP methyl ester carboxylesterase